MSEQLVDVLEQDMREMLVIPREILGDYAVSRLTERYLSR